MQLHFFDVRLHLILKGIVDLSPLSSVLLFRQILHHIFVSTRESMFGGCVLLALFVPVLLFELVEIVSIDYFLFEEFASSVQLVTFFLSDKLLLEKLEVNRRDWVVWPSGHKLTHQFLMVYVLFHHLICQRFYWLNLFLIFSSLLLFFFFYSLIVLRKSL